eukprot:6205172-Pleurochrysis_carterae.AAC.1
MRLVGLAFGSPDRACDLRERVARPRRDEIVLLRARWPRHRASCKSARRLGGARSYAAAGE